VLLTVSHLWQTIVAHNGQWHWPQCSVVSHLIFKSILVFVAQRPFLPQDGVRLSLSVVSCGGIEDLLDGSKTSLQ